MTVFTQLINSSDYQIDVHSQTALAIKETLLNERELLIKDLLEPHAEQRTSDNIRGSVDLIDRILELMKTG